MAYPIESSMLFFFTVITYKGNCSQTRTGWYFWAKEWNSKGCGGGAWKGNVDCANTHCWYWTRWKVKRATNEISVGKYPSTLVNLAFALWHMNSYTICINFQENFHSHVVFSQFLFIRHASVPIFKPCHIWPTIPRTVFKHYDKQWHHWIGIFEHTSKWS